MSVAASLVPGKTPQLVQLVIDETPPGESWRLTGHVGGYSPGTLPGEDALPGDDFLPGDSMFVEGSYSWGVPGGYGIGDGGQVVLVDNRAPGNVPVTYRMTTDSGFESSNDVTVPFLRDMVIQTADGQNAVTVDLLDGSLDTELPTSVGVFRVPGRSRPVTRYDVVSDVVSKFTILVPVEDSSAFRAVIASGQPVVYRFGTTVMDLDPVSLVQLTGIASKAYSSARLRVWELDYVLVDDPYADVRLGASTWDEFDAVFDGRPWEPDFDAMFTGLDWDAFDRTVWTDA